MKHRVHTSLAKNAIHRSQSSLAMLQSKSALDASGKERPRNKSKQLIFS